MKVAETPVVVLFDGPLPLKDNKPQWMTSREDVVQVVDLEQSYKDRCSVLFEMLQELGGASIKMTPRDPRQHVIWNAITVVDHPKGWRVNISSKLHPSGRKAILKRLEKLAKNRKFVRQTGGCWITKAKKA